MNTDDSSKSYLMSVVREISPLTQEEIVSVRAEAEEWLRDASYDTSEKMADFDSYIDDQS